MWNIQWQGKPIRIGAKGHCSTMNNGALEWTIVKPTCWSRHVHSNMWFNRVGKNIASNLAFVQQNQNLLKGGWDYSKQTPKSLNFQFSKPEMRLIHSCLIHLWYQGGLELAWYSCLPFWRVKDCIRRKATIQYDHQAVFEKHWNDSGIYWTHVKIGLHFKPKYSHGNLSVMEPQFCTYKNILPTSKMK